MKLSLLLIVALLSGCATNQAVLTNSSGQQYHCSSRGYGIISSAIANSTFEDCVAAAKEKGYTQ